MNHRLVTTSINWPEWPAYACNASSRWLLIQPSPVQGRYWIIGAMP